ncbi:FAD-dependent oxidoreductase [Roseitranquillus sediminis]|uniref:FAD-dependent oxidoreductase n=1 Tax=Roseitranquillus sediminis TaxID=2809051 RepID=UPI001D0CAB49|nr:FAD-dependent oxidoreductase [Roseitranquillus sediminis]MBM9593502.1 FAD-dependent oxidoreductase [Roseitranquillus sediminis]
MAYEHRRLPYRRAPGLDAPEPCHDVVIVGAGPVGLAMALDLANHGQGSVLLDDNDRVSIGSRAICWSKRSLEILARLGVGHRCVEKGVTWHVGRTFHRDREIFAFDLLPEDGHEMPAFVNLQQYHVEEYLTEAVLANPLIDFRPLNRVAAIRPALPELYVQTPEGSYTLQARYVLACDGARSAIRTIMRLEFAGELFEERFLIADIEMKADFPPERRFWFEPPFHPGQSALLHKQPDNIWRIDLQLGWDADPEAERAPERVIPRIERMVGHRDFRLDWVSVYSFQCRRLDRFVHGPVIFVGDSAHVVSPFGARGGNGGLQDVDALGWRLAALLAGRASERVLSAYDAERTFGADENIRNSTRTTRFMTPADGVERLYRDSTLALAAEAPFARALANSGRLSRPCTYPLDAPDDPALPATSRPGSVAPDAPLEGGWLMRQLGPDPVLLALGREAPRIDGVRILAPALNDHLRQRYLGNAPGALCLIRPDQVVGARWTTADAAAVSHEIDRMWGRA